MKEKEIKLKEKIKENLHKFHKTTSTRFIELDFLRGLAIILMIFGHILWDLNHYKIMPMNNILYSGLQSFVPPLFFLLVGMCLIISKKKVEAKNMDNENEFYKHLIIRGLKILGLGMVITAISLVVFPGKPVVFGVLHCIGLSVIISAPFLKYRNYNILFAVSILFGGLILSQISFENPSIFHLIFGLHPQNIWSYTVDYFPLVPWFGIALTGIVIGDWLYCGEKRMFKIPDLSEYKPAKIFSWAGQHSLSLYLIHQPLIAGTIILFLRA